MMTYHMALNKSFVLLHFVTENATRAERRQILCIYCFGRFGGMAIKIEHIIWNTRLNR